MPTPNSAKKCSRSAITRVPGSVAMKPSSINDFSAIGKTSVLSAARTRNSPASAMRPRYGRTNGSRPLRERTARGPGMAGLRAGASAVTVDIRASLGEREQKAAWSEEARTETA